MEQALEFGVDGASRLQSQSSAGLRRPAPALCIVPGAGPRGAWARLAASAASRVTGSRAQPCARRVRRTPGTRAGGIERRLARSTAFEHAEALDHGPHRVAVALRGQRQRLGGPRAAMSAGPSEAGHQVEGAAGVSLHQRPDGRGAANGLADGSLGLHRQALGPLTRITLPRAECAIPQKRAPPGFSWQLCMDHCP